MISANLLHKISAKTASYQIVPADIGTTFTNRGAAGAVTFTLPPVADVQAGWWAEVFVVADQSVVIASSGSADNLVTLNDAGADTITINTASERIGFGSRIVYDGTGWLCFNHLGAEAQTIAIA